MQATRKAAVRFRERSELLDFLLEVSAAITLTLDLDQLLANVAEIVRYAQPAPELFDAAPRVKAWLTACQARPAFRKMWEVRDKEPA